MLPGVAVLALASTVQAAVGFGSGLLGIPVLLWMGVPLPHTVALFVGGTIVQTGAGVWEDWEVVDGRRTLRIAAAQYVGVCFGIAIMGAITSAGPDVVKQFVGGFVLLALLAQSVNPTPRSNLKRRYEALTGSVSGMLSGALGMGGPPLVLFALAHDWSRRQFRAFLWAQMLIMQPVLIAVLRWRFGPEIMPWFFAGLASAPLLWLATRAGEAATAKADEVWIRRAARLMLLVIAVSSVGGPVLRRALATSPAAVSQLASPGQDSTALLQLNRI